MTSWDGRVARRGALLGEPADHDDLAQPHDGAVESTRMKAATARERTGHTHDARKLRSRSGGRQCAAD